MSSTSAAGLAAQWEGQTAGRCLLQKQACTSLHGRRTRVFGVQRVRTQSSRFVSESESLFTPVHEWKADSRAEFSCLDRVAMRLLPDSPLDLQSRVC